MSNAIDDKELDEYLSGSGGTQYSQRYRSISADEVPAELDRFVLAQANVSNVSNIDAVAKRSPKRARSLSFWMRVSTPIALAASLVLVVSIMLDNGGRYDSASSVHEKLKKEMPERQAVPFAQSPASPEPKTEAKDNYENDSAAIARVEKTSARQTRAKMDSAAAQSRQVEAPAKAQANVAAPTIAPKLEGPPKPTGIVTTDEVSTLRNLQAQAPALAAPAERADAAAKATADKRSEVRQTNNEVDLSEIVVTGSYRRGQTANSGAGPRGSVPPANFEEHELSDAELAKQYREATPAAWLTYIRELRTSGKSGTADREWKRFVKAYPTYTVLEGDSARPKQ